MSREDTRYLRTNYYVVDDPMVTLFQRADEFIRGGSLGYDQIYKYAAATRGEDGLYTLEHITETDSVRPETKQKIEEHYRVDQSGAVEWLRIQENLLKRDTHLQLARGGIEAEDPDGPPQFERQINPDYTTKSWKKDQEKPDPVRAAQETPAGAAFVRAVKLEEATAAARAEMGDPDAPANPASKQQIKPPSGSTLT